MDVSRLSWSTSPASLRGTSPSCLVACLLAFMWLDASDGLRLARASAEDCGNVQLMMAGILLERSRRCETTATLPHRRKYPWGRLLDGPFDSFGANLMRLPRPQGWPFSGAFFSACCLYLNSLIWPRIPAGCEERVDYHVTWVELALDFEVVSGLDLPEAKRRRPGAPVPVGNRAQALSKMVALIAQSAAPELVHGGERRTLIYSLTPLEISRSAGLTRRPLLAGGAITESALRQLEAFSQSTSVRHGRLRTGWTQASRVARLPRPATGRGAPMRSAWKAGLRTLPAPRAQRRGLLRTGASLDCLSRAASAAAAAAGH